MTLLTKTLLGGSAGFLASASFSLLIERNGFNSSTLGAISVDSDVVWC